MKESIKYIYNELMNHNLVEEVTINKEENTVKASISFAHPPDDEMINSMKKDLKKLENSDWTLENGIQKGPDGFVAYFVN